MFLENQRFTKMRVCRVPSSALKLFNINMLQQQSVSNKMPSHCKNACSRIAMAKSALLLPLSAGKHFAIIFRVQLGCDKTPARITLGAKSGRFAPLFFK
jgi:hypothetical protein